MYRSVVPPFSEKNFYLLAVIKTLFFRRHGLFITLGYFHLHMLFRFRRGTRQTCLVTIIFCWKFEKCKDIKSTFPWESQESICKCTVGSLAVNLLWDGSIILKIYWPDMSSLIQPRIVSFFPIDAIPMSLRHCLSTIASALPVISASKKPPIKILRSNYISWEH